MKRLKEIMIKTMMGFYQAASRFPLTVLLLAIAAMIVCYMVQLHEKPPIILEKLFFSCLFGAVFSAAAQAARERKIWPKAPRLIYVLVSLLFTIAYYVTILPAQKIEVEVLVRTMVAIFALLCLFVWLPSYKQSSIFAGIPITHFKSFFTSVLYSGVLMMGIFAIITAVDVLLFDISNDAYAYTASIIWIFFFPLYYLSLLPRFNSEEEGDRQYVEKAALCPKYLEILLSYIAIPLILTFTGVLVIYFFKIVLTQKWPVGQLGPIVLGYSTAGLLTFLLCSVLENRFATTYKRLFPKIWMPIVMLQLVSIGIRLNAYGITESRYYITLFGIFSLTAGAILSIKHTGRNGLVVLLAAAFAVFSIIPPVDTFTVSRISQTKRAERMLKSQNMLEGNVVTPKSDVPEEVKTELTNVLTYLDSRGYTGRVAWLPKDFQPYNDMKTVIGFEPFYTNPGYETARNYYIQLDNTESLDISGYDSLNVMYSNQSRYANASPSANVDIRGNVYRIDIKRTSDFDAEISITDPTGSVIVSTLVYEQAQKLTSVSHNKENSLPPSTMAFNVDRNGSSLKVIFQHITINPKEGADYSFYILFKAPK